MNLRDIARDLPRQQQWWQLTRAMQKRWAEILIARVLRAILRQRRQPSEWQAVMIVGALRATAFGMYRLAVNQAVRAVSPGLVNTRARLPKHQRSMEWLVHQLRCVRSVPALER